ELAAAGRRVHLAVGGHKTLPRRYRGHDTYWWMDRLGMLSRSVDTLPGGRPPRRSRNAVLAGGTQDLDVPTLAAQGVVVHGRFLDVRDGVARFGDDLAPTPTPTGSAPPSTRTSPPTGTRCRSNRRGAVGPSPKDRASSTSATSPPS